jgi:phosphoadenosine phosphosulfate reductase
MPAPDARAERPGQPSLTGEVDAEGSIWKEGAFRRDPWRPTPAGGELGASPLLLDKARWTAERGTLLSRPAPIGLALEGGESVDDIADDLARFALIALNFAKFSDGRAFSTARLLREKFGYGGELRAVGNVLSDQIPFMRRVGFDAFEVHHAPTRRALSEGRIAEVRLYYQPVGPAPAPGTRAWLRGSVG